MNYYSVLDAGMAWEASQFGDLSRDESVILFLISELLIDVIEGSVKRTPNYCMFIADFALLSPNSRETSMSYDKHLKNLRLYKNRCA